MENPYGPTRASVTPHYYHRQSPRSTTSSQSNHTHHNHQPQNLMISHHPQQYYVQLPVIVNNNNGNAGGHLHNNFPQQKHHIGEEAAAQLLGANSNGSSTQIIVVDPPRPPFIPKKPVISASTTGGNGNGTTNSPHHPHPQQPVAAVAPIYSHHLQQQQQMNNFSSSPPSFQQQKPPNSHHLQQQQHIYAPPITSTTMTGMATTTTYIGANGNAHTMVDSPQLDLEEGDYHVSHLSSGSRVTDEETTTEASSCFPVIEPEQQQQQHQETLHYNVTGGNPNGFGLNGSPNLGQNFSNSVGNANNSVEKSTLKNHRRLSLINGIPSQQLQPFAGQRPPISSFGYSSEVGRLGEAGPGRIYATAGFSVTGLPMRRQAGMKSAGSQICLSQNGGTDGKATLSRKAQKLAQKAANTVGTLGSELSSSASALYSLFTSSSSAHEDCGQNEGKAAVAKGNGSVVYAESNGAKNGKNRGELPSYSTSQQIYGNIWDKAPVVSAHTSRGIDFLERYGQFIKERAMIEEEYAAKMKNLVKKSRGKKSDDEEFRMYTTASAYQAMLNELESLASQHEVISERLRGELIPQLSEKCRHLRAGRKKHSQDFDAMEKGFQARVDELYKQKKNYEKAHMDAQNAHIKYVKAEKNMTLSRLDVEKAKQNSNTKSAICEQSKQSYAAQLATTNQAKFEHFNVLLPRLLEDMRRLDVDRIQFTKHAMLESVKVETGVLNIIQRCYTDMNTAIGTIDPDKDTHVVVEQTKTGFSHPVDFAFEDLGCPSAIVSDDTSSFDGSTMKRPASAKNGNGKGVARKQSMKLFSGTGGKTNGTGSGSQPSIASSGEYGTLPPQQRCRRIQQKLEELRKELKIKNDSYTGLEKMHNVYTNDRKMGDPMEVMKQLQQNRHENLLLHAQSELNQPLGGHHNNTTTNSTVGSSSPGSSPRGSAGNILMNSSVGHKIPRTNGAGHGERGSSYSEASSISSADGATMHVNGGAGRQHVPQAPMPPNVVQQTSSTISTSGFSSTNATPVTSNHQQIQHIDADFYEECDGPVGGAVNGGPQHSDLILGTASAVYPYDAAPDEVGGTTISMKQGDDLLLLERDVGDGWTRVRHQKSGAEGFVPTSYLDCKWYPAH